MNVFEKCAHAVCAFIRKWRVVAAIAAIVLGPMAAPAGAQTVSYTMTNWDTVAQVEPSGQGWVWVRMTGGKINCSSVGGPQDDVDVLLRTDGRFPFDANGLDRLYSTLLTAKLTGSVLVQAGTAMRASAASRNSAKSR